MGYQVKDIINKSRLEDVMRIASSFKILSDPTRLKILCLLLDNKEGLCVNEIAEYVKVSQSAASHQLAKLEARAVLNSFRDGQMICYRIAQNEHTTDLIKVMKIFRK